MAQITGNSGAPTRPSSLPRWPQKLAPDNRDFVVI
jgi:hypothetical protein